MTAPISIQLYTLREAARSGIAPVIDRLARIGYAGVETAGLAGLTPEEFRRTVEDAGLRVSAAHVTMPIGDGASRILDEQQALGCETLVVAFLPPERFADADAVRSVADELNAANENARARGLTLGYHNHWWEFASRIGGRTAHSVLFEALDPAVFAEVDTYWARVGGVDPAQVLAGLGPRARLIHVKDGPADDPESDMTAVGEGVIDVPAVIEAAPDAEWHVVELDRCATDMFEAVERSHRYLVGKGFSRGRA